MKNIFLTFLLLIFAGSIFGQEMLKSFYFESNCTEPTPYSSMQFEQFKKSLESGQVHILEINSFTDSTGSVKGNESLAQQRLDYFVSRIPLDTSVKLNVYALDRPYRLPKAVSSRRVDIIYIIGPKLTNELAITDENQIILISNESVENPAVTELRNDPETEDAPKNKKSEIKESYEMNIPFVINVQFKEGTSKILPISYKEVTKVAQFMKENPSLHAEIRGHVCCGNNMRISTSRAKSVYKRLIKTGIPKERLSYIGKSNTEPIVFPEVTEADRQKNRRVDVKFSLR